MCWILQFFANLLANFDKRKWDYRAVQRSALCRSRRELSNAYLLAKFGLDTAENEPCEVCPTEQCRRQRQVVLDGYVNEFCETDMAVASWAQRWTQPPGGEQTGQSGGAGKLGLVLSCIEAKICKKICVGKLSPRSTQCTPLHRSQSSIFRSKIADFCWKCFC